MISRQLCTCMVHRDGSLLLPSRFWKIEIDFVSSHAASASAPEVASGCLALFFGTPGAGLGVPGWCNTWGLVFWKSATTSESSWGGGSCPGLSLEFPLCFCSRWDGLAPAELVCLSCEILCHKWQCSQGFEYILYLSLFYSCFIHRITTLYTYPRFKWCNYLVSCLFCCLILLLCLQLSSILAPLGEALQRQLSLGLLRLAGISWHLLHYMPWWQWDWMSWAKGVMEKWKSKVVVKRNLDVSAGVTGDEMQKKVAHEHIRRKKWVYKYWKKQAGHKQE